MNMIDRIQAAAAANGWTWSRDLTGDGLYTRLTMTRGQDTVIADVRHYYGKPKLMRAALGGPPARATVAGVLAYLGTA